MDRTYGGVTMQAEVLLRTLAAAVNAVRLYPTTSPLRSEAIARFTRDAREVTRGHGPVQFYIDRKRFIFAETAIGEGLPQIAALAEALHALQVGQLIVAPELTEQEVATFLDVLGRDAHEVRTSGGARAALLDNGVENIAVIEVTLRASSEHGLLGLDLTTAPLEDIADELQSTVAAWESTVACGEESEDMVAEAIGRLEPAARDLAMRRCAEALLLLDEETRLQMMSASLGTGPKGQQMEGMLEVVAHMQPAALARLLRLTAASLSSPAESLLPAIEFPPGLEAELAALLRPSQRSEEQSGVPPEADVVGIVADAATEDEDDLAYIGSLVAASTPKAAAARGLSTTVEMARERRSVESVKAMADAIPPAVREGALTEIAAAALFMRELADDPKLANAVQTASAPLHERSLLELCARQLAENLAPDAARILLETAGSAGAEALVAVYLESNEVRRNHLLPAISAMIESVAPVTGRVLRSGDAASAMVMLHLLGSMGSRRLAPTIAAGLEHLDVRVREAAMVALAASPGPESSQFLQKALTHWDPETRRTAVREIGRTGREDCVPALLKIVAEMTLFERNYELKKEVLKSLDLLHSKRAVPVLKRLANRRLVLDKKNRELRYLARRVLESLE